VDCCRGDPCSDQARSEALVASVACSVAPIEWAGEDLGATPARPPNVRSFNRLASNPLVMHSRSMASKRIWDLLWRVTMIVTVGLGLGLVSAELFGPYILFVYIELIVVLAPLVVALDVCWCCCQRRRKAAKPVS
jgi:hypothetical protein